MTHINFEDFRRRAESDPVSYMLALQPGGAYDERQREYYAATPQGGAGRSCKTSLRPDKMFVGQDFADSGFSWSGPIDIACAAFGLSKDQSHEAVKRAAEHLGYHSIGNQGSHKRPPEAALVPLPPPDGSLPDFRLGDRQPSLVSVYRQPDGAFFCCVVRYEPRHDGERKLILPWAYGKLCGMTDWHRKMPAGPRPLLGIEEYAAQPGASPVLIVEGEKTREAAKRMVGKKFFVTTWSGGCQVIDKTDFRILDGAVIYIWPDADEPGAQAAVKAAEVLKHYQPSQVFIVTPPDGVKLGWDLADAETEGWQAEDVERHIESFSVPYEKDRLTEVMANDDADTPVFGPPVPFDDQSPPPMPTDILPGILSQYSAAVAEAIQAPFELALINALGATAAVAQGKFKVSMHEGYSEPLNIFALAAMPPGERKSAVVEACRFPLLEWEAGQKLSNESIIRQALAERQVHEESQRRLLASAKNCQTPEERKDLARQLAAMKEEAGEPPSALRLLVDDATPEALVSLMSQQGGRLAMLEAEGGFFDILSGRYSGGTPNLDAVLKSWSGEAIRIDRRNAESVILNSPTLTLILSAQPDVLSGLAQTSSFRGRGLLGRMLFLLPKSMVGTRRMETTPIPGQIRETYRATLLHLLNLPWAENSNGEPTYYPLRLESAARHLWLDFAAGIEGQLAEGGALHTMRDWGGKLPGQILRLAGLVHVTVNPNPAEKTISPDVMAAVIRLSEFLIGHAKTAYSLLGADDAIECAKAILKWLTLERLDSFTARACLEKIKGRWPKMEQVNPGLSVLEDRGYILPEVVESPKRGRPSRVYLVNPALHGRPSC
ncbi:DUF3987 domain-containing protein [Deltaproteobacteria bacterium OttesenSCG-928-K17]|nr:DUF3987 domain-containing protein [Deltaproteobacteria bacterium OttesenSCG-928-K17]